LCRATIIAERSENHNRDHDTAKTTSSREREWCGYMINNKNEREECTQNQRESGQEKNDSDNKTFNDGKS